MLVNFRNSLSIVLAICTATVGLVGCSGSSNKASTSQASTQAASDEAASDEAASDEAASDEAASDEAASSQAASSQAASDQAATSDQASANVSEDNSEKDTMTASDESNPAEVGSGEPDPQVITLGGGCFWCVEAVFEEMEGVTSAVSGYAGGAVGNPSYEAVCTGTTGHAEVCEIKYDASKVELGELLEVFFKTHDPTTLNRQGPDFGTQYRSTIMCHDDAQKKFAEEYIKRLDDSGAYGNKIVTEVVAAPDFFAAEEYHQDYYRKNPGAGYCVGVVAPKVSKFRDLFPEKRKKSE